MNGYVGQSGGEARADKCTGHIGVGLAQINA